MIRHPFFPDDDGEDALAASINTTPLVDVMLVLLIIFLITIPVVTHSVAVALPREVNQPTETRPQNIILAVDRDGGLYWNDARLENVEALVARLQQRAAEAPPPEVQIRADKDARYAFVGQVVAGCQRAGISRVAFIVDPSLEAPAAEAH